MTDASTNAIFAVQPDRMRCMEIWGGNRNADNWFQMPGLEVWVYSQPSGQAEGGGDVYYISSCASGRITRMLLADVCGHGALVSRTAIGLRDLMRKNVNYIQQTRLVQEMNRQFAQLVREGGFATVLVNTFFAPTRTLTLCNAGHPSPLVFRAKNASWEILAQGPPVPGTITDTPLGVVDQAQYRQLDIELAPGDLVLCYSDALSEAEGPDGQVIGTEGLRKIAEQLEPSAPSRLIPDLLDAVKAQHPDNLTVDDVTLLLVQATGTKTSLRNNLLAPFRLLAPPVDSTQWRSAREG